MPRGRNLGAPVGSMLRMLLIDCQFICGSPACMKCFNFLKICYFKEYKTVFHKKLNLQMVGVLVFTVGFCFCFFGIT